MPLSETRIVLFEKEVLFEKDVFNRNFHAMLDDIECSIKNSKRGNNKCVYISALWTRDKLIRKILNQNGYTVTTGMYLETARGRNNVLETKISWD